MAASIDREPEGLARGASGPIQHHVAFAEALGYHIPPVGLDVLLGQFRQLVQISNGLNLARVDAPLLPESSIVRVVLDDVLDQRLQAVVLALGHHLRAQPLAVFEPLQFTGNIIAFP